MGIPWRRIGGTDTDKKVKERRRAIVIRLVPALQRQLERGVAKNQDLAPGQMRWTKGYTGRIDSGKRMLGVPPSDLA